MLHLLHRLMPALAAFSPSVAAGMLASCGYDRRVILWREAAHGRWEQAFVYESHELSGGCFLRCTLCSSALAFSLLKALRFRAVNGLCFGPLHHDVLVLGCASSDGTVSIIRYQDGQWNAQRFTAHHMGVNALAFSPDRLPTEQAPSSHFSVDTPSSIVRIATGGCDELIKIWRCDREFLPHSPI